MPAAYPFCPSLCVQVAGNHLRGPIDPALWCIPTLDYLRLQFNTELEGCIPDSCLPTNGSLSPTTAGDIGPTTAGDIGPTTAGDIGPTTAGDIGPTVRQHPIQSPAKAVQEAYPHLLGSPLQVPASGRAGDMSQTIPGTRLRIC